MTVKISAHPYRKEVLAALSSLCYPEELRAATILKLPAFRKAHPISLTLSPEDLALALHDLLIKGISNFRPAGSENLTHRDWLRFYSLHYLYVRGERAVMVQQRLEISRSYLYEIRNQAVDGLATWLFASHEQGFQPADAPNHAAQLSANNVPRPLTPFIGRVDELNRISQILSEPDCRILVLTGLGGTGKTRLAIEVANNKFNDFEQGVFFLSFFDVAADGGTPADPNDYLISRMISGLYQNRPITLAPTANEKLDLFNLLRECELLIILDSFEVVIESAPLLTELLSVAPRIKLLISSRTPLKIDGEFIFPVPGLGLPTGDNEALALQSDAVQLYLQCWRRLRASKNIENLDLAEIVSTCRLLNGMPLGIEIASMWNSILSESNIRQQIETNIGFLESQRSDISNRHRSVQTVIEQSVSTLTPSELEVFRNLSIFHDSFSATAARNVTGASYKALTSLNEKALLQVMDDFRYSFHPLIKQVASMRFKSESSPDSQLQVITRYIDYYANLLKTSKSKLQTKTGSETIASLKREHNNICAAWKSAVEVYRPNKIESMLPAISHYLASTSQTHERLQLMVFAENGLKLRAETDSQHQVIFKLLSLVRVQKSRVLTSLGRNDEAECAAREALATVHSAQDQSTEISVLRALGDVLIQSSKLSEGSQLLEKALELAKEYGDPNIEAGVLNRILSIPAHNNNWTRHKELSNRSLELARGSNNLQGEAIALIMLGAACLNLGNLAESLSSLTLALELGKKTANENIIQAALGFIGIVLMRIGRLEDALSKTEEALRSFRQADNVPNICQALSMLGLINDRLNRHSISLKLCEEGIELAQRSNFTSSSQYANLYYSRGHALFGQNRLDEARESYNKSAKILESNNTSQSFMGQYAGLARIALEKGDCGHAIDAINLILDSSEPEHLCNIVLSDPDGFRILLTCHDVLISNNDPRAHDILDCAWTTSQDMISSLNEVTDKLSFVSSDPYLNELLERYSDKTL